MKSEHPGCVYCMKAGTKVKQGEVCPVCGDRLPTQEELEESFMMIEQAKPKEQH